MVSKISGKQRKVEVLGSSGKKKKTQESTLQSSAEVC